MVSKRLPFVRRAAYGGARRQDNVGRAQRTTAEPHGTPRNTQKGRSLPRIHLFFYAPPRFFSCFPLSSSISQCLTFRWFRNALHLPKWRRREARRLDNGGAGTTDNRGTPRRPAELKMVDCALKSTCFYGIPSFFVFSFAPLPRPLPTPNVSAVSKRLPFVRRAE